MEKIKCAHCGKEITDVNDITLFIKENDAIELFCRQCNALFGTCGMCQHTYCGFVDDPDPMPQFKMVARQMRQGNAVFVEQRQVPNAERIKKFCIDADCKCFNKYLEHPLCCRHGGYATCTNYCEVE